MPILIQSVHLHIFEFSSKVNEADAIDLNVNADTFESCNYPDWKQQSENDAVASPKKEAYWRGRISNSIMNSRAKYAVHGQMEEKEEGGRGSGVPGQIIQEQWTVWMSEWQFDEEEENDEREERREKGGKRNAAPFNINAANTWFSSHMGRIREMRTIRKGGREKIEEEENRFHSIQI